MLHRHSPGKRSGFTLVELLVGVVVTVLILSVVPVAAQESRRLGRLGEDLAQLKRFGAATGQYAADSSDRFWTFSWRAGNAPIDPTNPVSAGLYVASTDLE